MKFVLSWFGKRYFTDAASAQDAAGHFMAKLKLVNRPDVKYIKEYKPQYIYKVWYKLNPYTATEYVYIVAMSDNQAYYLYYNYVSGMYDKASKNEFDKITIKAADKHYMCNIYGDNSDVANYYEEALA